MKVSWDDDIPNISKNKIHAPNHQADIYIYNGAKGTGDNSAVTNGNSCWFPQPAPTSPYLLTPLTPGFPDRVGRVGFLHVVGGSLGLVDQVRVEDVELVAWRIDEIQMNYVAT